VIGIAAAMHYRSDEDQQAKEWVELLEKVGPKAALAQVSGLPEDGEVVAEAVSIYEKMH